MKKIKTKIQNFLYKVLRTSYGSDDLNNVLLYGGVILSVLNLFIHNFFISILAFGFSITFLFRFFSKNIVARTEENRAYRKFLKYLKLTWEYRRTHRIYICRKCGQLIRVPKKQGKIIVTCPNCGDKKEHRT